MELPPYPQQAIAIRRQTAFLSHRTYTTERHLLFDAIIRMSFDCGRAEAPVQSQAWLAWLLGLSRADVCRAEKCLIRFGMLRVRRGADNYRLYEPQSDADTWAGENFRWRIADKGRRNQSLQAEMRVAASAGPGPAGQATFDLPIVPTVTDEYRQTFRAVQTQAAVDAAGALPIHPPSTEPHPRPDLSSGRPSSHHHDPEPRRGTRAWYEWKSRLGLRGGVGQPANASNTEPSSALAAQPTQEGQPLAGRPTPLEERWLGSQHSDPTSGGASLAGQPTTGGPTGLSEPSGARGVGRPPNALASQPTPASAPTSNASARHQTSNINISTDIHVSSHITPEAGMQDVASVAGRMADGRSAPDRLLGLVFEVVATPTERIVKHWRRLLATPPMQQIAVDLLGEIKIRRDEQRQGIGQPINVEGAWFVSEFYKRAGLPRKGGRGK